MDDSERLVEKYLNELDRGSVVFEPDGNIPPDFALAGSIGVEVRRLNQNYEYPDGSTEGLEKLTYPLRRELRKLLSCLGDSVDGESWFVTMDFRRPVPCWKQLKKQLKKMGGQKLKEFKDAAIREQTTITITRNFKLDLFRASTDCGRFFLFGGHIDHNLGGWIMHEVGKNLRLSIVEKEQKISRYRARYEEWWLVLPDRIGYSLEQEDREIFRAEIIPNLQNAFNKIVLLDPRGLRDPFEI